MPVSLFLQAEHGYCLLALVLGSLVANLFGSHYVMKARKAYNVKYPTMYLPPDHKHANAFNCAQRAHQNVLEQLSLFCIYSLTASFYRPLMTTAAILLRMVGFVAYIRGYNSGNPQSRLQGAFGFLGLLIILVLNVEVAVRWVTTA